MTAGSPTEAPATGAPAFEVERFEWAGPDRLEVAGRWSGVRGRRFVRPTLDVEGAGDQRRLLAVLDHKPWAAEDGRRWVAAFPWDGGEVSLSGAELAVAPGIAVALGPPGSAGPAAASPAAAPAPSAPVAPVAPDVRALERERDAALGQRAGAVRDRDRLLREREAALRDRDAARRESDAAAAAAEALRADLEAVRTQRDRALRELEAMRDQRDAARAEAAAAAPQAPAPEIDEQALRDALAERDAALAARDAALAAPPPRDDAAEREIARLREQLRAARTEAEALRSAAPVPQAMHDDEPPAGTVPGVTPPRPPGPDQVELLLARVLATGAIAGIIALVVLFLIAAF